MSRVRPRQRLRSEQRNCCGISGIGQNRDANNTKVAFAGKLQVRPLAFAPRLPQLILLGSVFTYSKTNGFTPTINTAFGFEFIHGIPANGTARRVAAGGGLFWRFLSARGEFFQVADAREVSTAAISRKVGPERPWAFGERSPSPALVHALARVRSRPRSRFRPAAYNPAGPRHRGVSAGRRTVIFGRNGTFARTWAAVGLVFAPAIAAAHDPPPPRSRYSTVVVTNRSLRTASQRVVGAAEVSTSPRRRSADDLLRLIPGVYVSQHGSEGKGQQIFLRGFDAAHGTDVEARVAGVPINELSNVHGQGYLDLNFVIPEVVRRISASKGPFLLDQGNFANAGTVRFDLGVDREVRGNRVSYEFGSTVRHRGVFVYAPKHLPKETFFAAEAMHDRGFGVAREAQRASLIGQIRVLNSPTYGALDLFGVAYAARFGAPGALRQDDVDAGRIPFNGAYVDDGRGRSMRAIAGLHHQLEIGRGYLEQRLYGQLRDFGIVEDFTGLLLDPERGDRRLQEHRFGSAGYQIAYRRPLGHKDRWTLVAGGAWQGDSITQHDARVDADHLEYKQNWALDVGQHQAHARAGMQWRPVARLSIDAGARVDVFAYHVRDRLEQDHEGRKTVAIPSPRLTTVLQVARDASLFAAYGRGLRAPEARSILEPATPPADVPLDRYRGGPARIVSSDAVEVGARAGWRDKFSAGLSLFGTWIDRELVFDHVSATNIELNRTRRLGAELDILIRPRPWLVIREDLTLVHARFVESGAPVPQAPPVMSATQLSIVHPSGFRAGARVLVLGPRPLPHGATAAGYGLLDLSVGYRFGPAQLDLQLDNVTNAKWHEGEYHFASWWDKATPRSSLPALHFIPGPPLTARIGLTLWM